MTAAPTSCGRCRDGLGAISVDGMCEPGFVLCLIDRRIGGGRDDDVGPCRRDRRSDRPGIGKIELRAGGGDKVDVPKCRGALDQASRDLPVAPGDQNLRHDAGLARRTKPFAGVAAAADRLPPPRIVEIPANRPCQPALESLGRCPAELALDLRGIDRVAAVMAGPVGDESRSARGSCRVACGFSGRACRRSPRRR